MFKISVPIISSFFLLRRSFPLEKLLMKSLLVPNSAMLDWNDYNFYYVCRRTRGSDLALCLNLKFLIMWGDSFIALLTGSAEFTPKPTKRTRVFASFVVLGMFSADYALCQQRESRMAGKRASGKTGKLTPIRAAENLSHWSRSTEQGSGIRITCVINAHPRACPCPFHEPMRPGLIYGCLP